MIVQYKEKSVFLHRQEIDRLFDFKKSTSLAKYESAFAALGKTLKIEVADAS